ncbi:hypothetical protein RB199_38700 [Streptomyces libani]|uniref:hypothetical protein n=1 Tax=Streptomyces nigrescens TaxID=1920 RepID=UPI00304497B9
MAADAAQVATVAAAAGAEELAVADRAPGRAHSPYVWHLSLQRLRPMLPARTAVGR